MALPNWMVRWRGRQPSVLSRFAWIVALLVGWWVWFTIVQGWAEAHGHSDWNEGRKSISGLLAVALYFVPAIVAWKLVFPGDAGMLPWHDPEEEQVDTPRLDDDAHRAVSLETHALLESLGSRLSTQDQVTARARLDAGELALALEHIAVRLGHTDQVLARSERDRLLTLVDRVQASPLARRSVVFLREE